MTKAEIGTVSHGTLRSEDLIEAFAAELERLAPDSKLIGEAQNSAYFEEHPDEASELVNELIDALNEHAPENCYFGAHEGDGSDFGFWPIETWQCDDERDAIAELERPGGCGAMRMSPEQFAGLAKVVRLAKGADMRERWDALFASGYPIAALYAAGLNDEHIDTALRAISRMANTGHFPDDYDHERGCFYADLERPGGCGAMRIESDLRRGMALTLGQAAILAISSWGTGRRCRSEPHARMCASSYGRWRMGPALGDRSRSRLIGTMARSGAPIRTIRSRAPTRTRSHHPGLPKGRREAPFSFVRGGGANAGARAGAKVERPKRWRGALRRLLARGEAMARTVEGI